MPGDLCSAQCESLAETCGPGTLAGGSITGHRVIQLSLHIPEKNGEPQELAGVRVGFDYPQLEASIKGTGLSSVVQQSFQVLATPPASGFLALANDTDTEAQIIVSSSEAFIDSTSGAFLQVTLDECTPLSTNICNRNQNVLGCCPTTDIVACNADPDNQVLCFCGANGIVSQTDCTTAGCTEGVCVGIPDAPAGSCVSGKCSPGSPNPGKACTPANETHTCSGVPVDQATCTVSHACSRLGDQTNGTYGCAIHLQSARRAERHVRPDRRGRIPHGTAGAARILPDQQHLYRPDAADRRRPARSRSPSMRWASPSPA